MAVWDDTRLAPHVRSAAKELGTRFSIPNIGGFATSGHIANSDHYKGLALDFMTFNGQALADFTVSNAGRLGVTYVIWNRRIWTPGGGWKAYAGASPHTDHVHVSFSAQGSDVQSIGNTDSSGCLGMLAGLKGTSSV